jgi:hypothetical protein
MQLNKSWYSQAWGQNYGGTGAAPSTGTYTKIYTTAHAFAALKADGSITAWGEPSNGGTTPAPNLANAISDVAKLTVAVSV